HKRSGHPATVEGKVVSFADRIAYLNHDIDDAIRAGVLTEQMIPPSCRQLFGETHSQRINNLILNLVENSLDSPVIRFSEEYAAEFEVLRDFMFENVYLNPVAKREEVKAKALVERLYEHYLANIEQMPVDYRRIVEEDGAERAVADFLSGMTDNYAIADYKRIFVPEGWDGI
ncbi:MAG: deoxyguanosinetriphosphate triphosphohydrolase, partial [Clostridia bacterium]|nr:deoxyguanosinetriphosphate triphosphohydrolase [Clostridia bacterium]